MGMPPSSEPGFQQSSDPVFPQSGELAIPAASRKGRMSRAAEEHARLCIQAATLRTRGLEFHQVADRMGLASPEDAAKLASSGFAIMPAGDLAEGRKLAMQAHFAVMAALWDVVDSPGPLVSQGRKVREVIGIDDDGKEVEGGPYPDQMVRTRALEAIDSTIAEIRHLGGYDAPKRKLVATLPLEEVRAYVEHLRAQTARGTPQASVTWEG